MSRTQDPLKQTRKSDFAAAEEITGILHGRDKDEQGRIIRWVGESLGLTSAAPGGKAHGPLATPQPGLSSGQAEQHPGVSASSRPKDLKTFVAEKRPGSAVHFAAVVAYYYQFEAPESERMQQITAQELQNAARLAGKARFEKPYVPLQNAAKQGYLDRAGSGSFRVNAVGENLVAMALPHSAGEGNALSKGKKKRKKAKARKPSKISKVS